MSTTCWHNSGVSSHKVQVRDPESIHHHPDKICDCLMVGTKIQPSPNDDFVCHDAHPSKFNIRPTYPNVVFETFVFFSIIFRFGGV